MLSLYRVVADIRTNVYRTVRVETFDVWADSRDEALDIAHEFVRDILNSEKADEALDFRLSAALTSPHKGVAVWDDARAEMEIRAFAKGFSGHRLSKGKSGQFFLGARGVGGQETARVKAEGIGQWEVDDDGV